MINIFQYRHWAISEGYYNQMLPLVRNLIEGGHSLSMLVKKKTMEDFLPRMQSLMNVEEGHPPVDSSFITDDASGFMMLATDAKSGLPYVKQGSSRIALMPVVGPLTKYGDLCSYGMQDYQSMIDRMNASDGLDGMVMMIDSPGGTVDGTPEFGMAVKNSKKPIGVFADSMMCSAALWVGSQASVVVGNKNNPTDIGSIGTLMIKQDYSTPMKKGYMPKMEIIRAPQSTDKALVNPVEQMTDATRMELNQELKELTDQFIGTVKAGRGDKLQSDAPGIFSGKTFDVFNAKKYGLIDSVGTLKTAVDKVAELVRTSTANGGNAGLTTTLSGGDGVKMDTTKEQMNILEFLGLSKEQKAKLSAEDQAKLDELETKFNAQEQELSALKTEKGTLTAKVSGLESANADLKVKADAEATAKDAEIADLKAKLDKAPAGKATTVVGAGDDKLKEAGLDKFKTSVDAEAAAVREAQKKMDVLPKIDM